jgi:hypothetical protein
MEMIYLSCMKSLFYLFLVLIGCAAEEELVPSTPATPTSNGIVIDDFIRLLAYQSDQLAKVSMYF